MATIYRKTSKGVAEIATRAHRLQPRLRSALIVVDGRRSDIELAPLILQDPGDTLQWLLDQGFIESAGAADPVPRPSAAAPPPVAPAAAAAAAPVGSAPSVDFSARRRDAVRRFTDQVGPMGEALAIRMERAGSADELRPLLVMALQVLSNTRGRQAALDYQARFSDL